MSISDHVLDYLQEFSDWLEKYEKKLAKVETQYHLEKHSGGKIPSKDIIQVMNILRKKIDKVTKVLTHNKDMADNFCNKAEDLVKNISKTLDDPKSLPKNVLSGLQTLQQSILKAVFTLRKKFKEALSPAHLSKHEEPHVTLIQKTKGFKPKHGTEHHQQMPLSRKQQRRHSFTRTGKE